MKISELSDEQIREYLRLNDDDNLLAIFKTSALEYIKSYTGLKDKEVEKHEEITTAYLVLIQDFYDNRQYATDKSYSNKAVDTILGMYRSNFIPKE